MPFSQTHENGLVSQPLQFDNPSSAVLSFQLRPVFGAATERVPSNDTTLRFVGLGNKSWDSFKNSFRTQGIEFSFLSQRARWAVFKGSIAPKTPF